MKRPARCEDDAVRTWLTANPLWRVVGTKLELEISAPYRVSCALAAATVPLADSLDHHPILTIGFNSLRIELWTHDRAGITELDLKLGEFVSQFLATRL